MVKMVYYPIDLVYFDKMLSKSNYSKINILKFCDFISNLLPIKSFVASPAFELLF